MLLRQRRLFKDILTTKENRKLKYPLGLWSTTLLCYSRTDRKWGTSVAKKLFLLRMTQKWLNFYTVSFWSLIKGSYHNIPHHLQTSVSYGGGPADKALGYLMWELVVQVILIIWMKLTPVNTVAYKNIWYYMSICIYFAGKITLYYDQSSSRKLCHTFGSAPLDVTNITWVNSFPLSVTASRSCSSIHTGRQRQPREGGRGSDFQRINHSGNKS